MSTSSRPTQAATPAVAIARALRSLGLVQGVDFYIRGHYVRGERRGTYATLFGRPGMVALLNAKRVQAAVSAVGGWACAVEVIPGSKAVYVGTGRPG